MVDDKFQIGKTERTGKKSNKTYTSIAGVQRQTDVYVLGAFIKW